MDPQASSQFIASLIKSIQVVCHGNVEFNHNIEIVGHIYLHVDKCQKFNYVLNEEVVKDSESTKFVSNSFPAEPPSREPDRKRRKVATPSSVTESDGATDLITISNDADELSSRLSHPPVVSSASPTVVVPSTPASNLRHRPRRPSFPANQSALSSSESERTPPPRTIATSQSQTLSQPQTRVPGPGVLLDPEVKPDVSGQTATSLSHPPSSRDSYVSSDPSLSGAGAAVTTTPPTTSEPDIQIKLEVPSEEEVQLLSHDIAGQVRGSSHPSHSVDPNSSPGSGSLYPVMLHQNLAATHTRDSGALSGSRAKRQHLESDIPVLSSAYSIGQDDFNLHSSNLPGSSNKQPGSQWNHPPQRMLQDPPNDGIAEPMVHFDTSLMGPRLSGGPTSTVTSMAQDSSSGSLEARDAQTFPWLPSLSGGSALAVESTLPGTMRPAPLGGQQWEGVLAARLKYPCRNCHKSFNTLSGRTYHENSMHKKVYKYMCNLCNKGYQCVSNYKGHMASHFSHLVEKCRKCGASFTFRGNRKRHEARCQRGSAGGMGS